MISRRYIALYNDTVKIDENLEVSCIVFTYCTFDFSELAMARLNGI